jgi:cytidylate kinase
MIIAIDGPAAAGKGTIAERLAAHYRLPYLDTGLLYRLIGKEMAERGYDPDDGETAGRLAATLDPARLKDPTLRGHEAGELASRVAVHGQVREALLQFQRDFARRPGGAVLDGRDIGTAVCPYADIKIYVTASPEVRARRRTDELRAKGRTIGYDRILAEIRERDARDSGRTVAPLKAAADAHLLDTTEMSIEAAFQAARAVIDDFLAKRDENQPASIL